MFVNAIAEKYGASQSAAIGSTPAITSAGYRRAARAASMKRAERATVVSSWPTSPRRTVWLSLTTPPCARSGFVSPAAMSLARSPRRFEMSIPMREARVSTPRAPMLTPMNTTTCPNGDQWLAMSTVARPVTQIVETAVKSASLSGVTVPLADAIGSENSTVNTRISSAKTAMANRDGDEVMRCFTRPAAPGRPVRGDDAETMPDIAAPFFRAVRSTAAARRLSPSLRHGTPCRGALP